MTNLATVVQQLRKERDQAQKRVEQLDQALEALIGVGGLRAPSGRRGRVNVSATRRTMSAAARRRIAAAQRARWAKWKAAQKGK
jgi:predicted ATPase